MDCKETFRGNNSSILLLDRPPNPSPPWQGAEPWKDCVTNKLVAGRLELRFLGLWYHSAYPSDSSYIIFKQLKFAPSPFFMLDLTQKLVHNTCSISRYLLSSLGYSLLFAFEVGWARGRLGSILLHGWELVFVKEAPGEEEGEEILSQVLFISEVGCVAHTVVPRAVPFQDAKRTPMLEKDGDSLGVFTGFRVRIGLPSLQISVQLYGPLRKTSTFGVDIAIKVHVRSMGRCGNR